MVVSQFHLEKSPTLGCGYFSSPREHRPSIEIQRGTQHKSKKQNTPTPTHKHIVFHIHCPKQEISQSNSMKKHIFFPLH